MKFKKLKFSEKDITEIKKLRIKLKSVKMNQRELDKIYASGPCGGICKNSCSWWCEPQCGGTCIATCADTCRRSCVGLSYRV